jgi:hypothetical protein
MNGRRFQVTNRTQAKPHIRAQGSPNHKSHHICTRYDVHQLGTGELVGDLRERRCKFWKLALMRSANALMRKQWSGGVDSHDSVFGRQYNINWHT